MASEKFSFLDICFIDIETKNLQMISCTNETHVYPESILHVRVPISLSNMHSTQSHYTIFSSRLFVLHRYVVERF